MHQSAQRREFGVVIIALACALMPFDALPILPGMYRPLPVFLSLLAFLYVLYDFAIRRLFASERATMWMLAFYLSAVPLSVLGGFLVGDFSGTIDFLTSFTLGFSFFLSCLYCFRRLPLAEEADFALAIAKLLLPLYCVSIGWGAIQALSMFVTSLRGVVGFLSTRLAEVPQFAVQWLSREPAWGVINVLGFLPFLRHYVKKTGKLRILVPLTYVEILLSLSLSGIGTMILIELVVWLSDTRNILRRILVVLGTMATVYLGVMVLLSSISGLRQIERFRTYVETRNIIDFLKYSSSETVRIGFPIAGIMEIVESPVVGVGGGNSRFYLARYLYALMPWATSMIEVTGYLDQPSSFSTPRNLFARIVGEQGLFGVVLFGSFVMAIWKLRRRFVGVDARLFIRVFITTLLINLQFDSWALAPMWLGFAFLISWGSIRGQQAVHIDRRSVAA